MPSDDVRIHPNLTDGSVVGIAQNLFEWMGEISPGVFIKAQAFKHADITTNQYTFGGESYRAVNVGFGLSYVLPIVLALLVTKPGGLVIIEIRKPIFIRGAKLFGQANCSCCRGWSSSRS